MSVFTKQTESDIYIIIQTLKYKENGNGNIVSQYYQSYMI